VSLQAAIAPSAVFAWDASPLVGEDIRGYWDATKPRKTLTLTAFHEHFMRVGTGLGLNPSVGKSSIFKPDVGGVSPGIALQMMRTEPTQSPLWDQYMTDTQMINMEQPRPFPTVERAADRLKWKSLYMFSEGSAMSVPAVSERFPSTRKWGDLTGSTNMYAEQIRARDYSGVSNSARRGSSISSNPTMAQAQSASSLLDDGLGGMQRIYGDATVRYSMKEPMLVRPGSATTSVGTILGKPPSGMRGSQLGRWDKPLVMDDPMLNIPLKARWKIREGGYAPSGSSGGYYGSGTPTGNLQSGVGVGGTSVRSGRQFLEIRALSSGMDSPLQDLSPKPLEIIPSRRTAMRSRAEELSYSYESRQLPPGMKRPSITGSAQIIKPLTSLKVASEVTPILKRPSITGSTQIIKPLTSLKVASEVTPIQQVSPVLSLFPLTKVDIMSTSTQVRKQMSIVTPALAFKQGQLPGIMQASGILQTQVSDVIQTQSIEQMLIQDSQQKPLQKSLQITSLLPALATIPGLTTLITPVSTVLPPQIPPYTKPIVQPPIKPVTGVPFPPFMPGSGGGGTYGLRGSKKWQYENPVATDIMGKPGRKLKGFRLKKMKGMKKFRGF